ncbi:MAG: GIN domain-containing protein [Gaiellaceae bacterium]
MAAFDRFELAGDAGVTIHVGEDRSVVVSADDNLLGRVTTAVRHGTLVVGTIGNYTAKTPMTVAVGVPTLDALVLSGDGLVNADGIDTARLAVLLSGDGALGAAGGAGRLVVRRRGAGAAQLQQLVARDVRATLSGDGQILVTATRSLHASVSGTGTIVYAGNPAHVTRSITGTGTIAMK